MKFSDKLEKHFGWFAIPNLTVTLIISQILVYIVSQSAPGFAYNVSFIPLEVYAGQWWRVLTFLAYPPFSSPLFMFFTWYFFYFLGKNLEYQWGDFRYTLFIFIGWLATVAFGLLAPFFLPVSALTVISNGFLAATVFLAFARFNPEYQILLFFILPIKVKWLAWFTWAGYFFTFIIGDWSSRLAVLASIANYLIFFGREHYQTLRYGYHSARAYAVNTVKESLPTHKCIICGATDKSNPEKEFRYCTKCRGKACYCLEHLHTHEHIQ